MAAHKKDSQSEAVLELFALLTKRGAAPQGVTVASNVANVQVLPPPKYIIQGFKNNPAANMKSGFDFERNKQIIDEKMKKASKLFPNLCIVKLATTKGAFSKSFSHEKFTRENYIVTKMKSRYVCVESICWRVSTMDGVELK